MKEDSSMTALVDSGLPVRSSALERLIATGRIVPARLDLMKLVRPAERPHEMTLSEALAEQRRED